VQSLNYSYNQTVSRAYIIRVKGHPKSEEKAQRCADSCDLAGMEWAYWDAYDGIQNPIKPPLHHGGVPAMVKVTDHYLTRGEVACALSHISLWQKCVLDDQPLVVWSMTRSWCRRISTTRSSTRSAISAATSR
jgi:GR25 family glycosyltransferase involved in LPS biosynthesis